MCREARNKEHRSRRETSRRLAIRSDRFPVFRSRATGLLAPAFSFLLALSFDGLTAALPRERESILYHGWLGKRKGTRFAPNFCFNSVEPIQGDPGYRDRIENFVDVGESTTIAVDLLGFHD